MQKKETIVRYETQPAHIKKTANLLKKSGKCPRFQPKCLSEMFVAK